MDNNDDFFSQLFDNKTPEEAQEENRKFELELIENNPPLVIPFGEFADLKGYETGHRNLYIVWYDAQALYVGITRSDIWNRWFYRGGQSHMYFAQKYSGTLEGGRWVGLSTIGRVIDANMPASLEWKIEMRYVPTTYTMPRWDLESEEKKLIRELRPLFNGTYRGELTEDERTLFRTLKGSDSP